MKWILLFFFFMVTVLYFRYSGCKPLLCFQMDKQQFEETMQTLNNLYAEAEKLGGKSYLEGCLACLTAYTVFLCMETHYEKVKLLLLGFSPWPKLLLAVSFVEKLVSSEHMAFIVLNCVVFCLQVLKKIARYIKNQNEKIYAPRGLLLTDPIERGLRVVSLTWLILLNTCIL